MHQQLEKIRPVCKMGDKDCLNYTYYETIQQKHHGLKSPLFEIASRSFIRAWHQRPFLKVEPAWLQPGA